MGGGVVLVSAGPIVAAGGIDSAEGGDIDGDEPVTLSGWAFDASARTSSGVDAVYLFIRPGTAAGSPATLNTATTIGTATPAHHRPHLPRRPPAAPAPPSPPPSHRALHPPPP